MDTIQKVQHAGMVSDRKPGELRSALSPMESHYDQLINLTSKLGRISSSLGGVGPPIADIDKAPNQAGDNILSELHVMSQRFGDALEHLGHVAARLEEII